MCLRGEIHVSSVLYKEKVTPSPWIVYDEASNTGVGGGKVSSFTSSSSFLLFNFFFSLLPDKNRPCWKVLLSKC